jgi:sulfatase maturation enzyme AslB (radical SAM superfamily)
MTYSIKKETWSCSLPWTGFSNDPDGKVRPCCIFKGHISDDTGSPYYVQTTSVKDIFSSQYMKNLRNQFRVGDKPAGCETCIKDESNGVRSKRMTSSMFFDRYEDEPALPTEYQMILSNACNLKCRSCTPSHSSSWQAEHKVMFGHTGYTMAHSQPASQNSLLWIQRKEWMSHLHRLEIVGGEPFYISQWQQLWNDLIVTGKSKTVDMDMSTNGSIYGGDVLKNILPHFRRIGIGLSIDGIGKTYEYLRHPGNWNEVSKNILKYNSLSKEFSKNLSFSYSHTISWINAFDLPEFYKWVNINTPTFQIWNNLVHWPRHMSIIMLPKLAKEKIQKKWNSADWGTVKPSIDGIINFMNSEQPTDQEITEQYKKFLITDRFRNENILNVIPLELIYDLQQYFEE